METLVEKAQSGQEIARGMDKHDKSKEQKKEQVVTKEVKKNANGSSSETHYDHIDTNVDQPMEPEAPPPAPIPPGQQMTVGNKPEPKIDTTPRTVEIKLDGKSDTLNMKPRLRKDPNRPQ